MNPDYITEDMRVMSSLAWFACDKRGAIAWFESGGYAPIPESVLVSDRDRREAVQLVEQLKPFTSSICRSDLSTKYLASLSTRGLYTYEVVDDPARSAPYECATTPTVPIHLDQLPVNLRRIIARTKLPCLFSECQQLPLDIVHAAKPFPE